MVTTRLWLTATAAFLAAGAAAEQVQDTRFNYNRGFYSSSITVVIQCSTPGARIRYTVDGSAPTPTAGLGNANPVMVKVDKTTALRALAYKKDMLPSNVDTQTYIFLRDVLKQPPRTLGYPNPQLRTGLVEMATLDYEMDPSVVDDPRHRFAIRKGLKSIPTVSIVMDKAALFRRVGDPELNEQDFLASGIYWGSTRPGSVELLHPYRPAKNMQVDTAVEGHSWVLLKRALRLAFKREYGAAKLKFPLFEDAPLHGETSAQVYDRIILRSGKNRSWATNWNPDHTSYTRDQWARDTQIAMSGLGSHGTFVHLYLNGLYWGLYNACERPDAWFLAAHLGGEKEDWFSANQQGPFQGDPTRWNYLTRVLKGQDMRDPFNYDELQQYLDVAQFADYLILCWYMRMEDWPEHNWYAGHRVNPPSPVMFFVWDAEESWESKPAPSAPSAWVHPQFRADRHPTEPSMVGIWHSLRNSRDFMTLFADRVYGHCFNDGALTDANAIARWRILNGFIEDAILAESARWGDALREQGEPRRTRDNTFYPEVERVAYRMWGNARQFVDALRQEGYYPSIDPPEFIYAASRDGRRVVEMRNPNQAVGEIYYTLNGYDPRLPGGGVTPSAVTAGDKKEVAVRPSTVVKARVKANAEWSALSEFEVPAGLLPDFQGLL